MPLKFCNIFHFVILICQCAAASDLLGELTDLFAKAVKGTELTTHYYLTLGTQYPPIDHDVTVFCLRPGSQTYQPIFLGDSLITTKIDFQLPINFVIHGFLSGVHGGYLYLAENKAADDHWMQRLGTDWSRFTHSNVCLVDWSRLANYEYGIAACKHTRMVANHLINIFNYLTTQGMNMRTVSIAGHSLGAHIAGFVGQFYQGVLYTIYGLDPAGPGFTFPFDFGLNSRLDASDAQYVQCILTAGGTLGTLKDCGHTNFVVNGGIVQPGCFTIFCSHSRSHEYFAEALYPREFFIGTLCLGHISSALFESILNRPCSERYERLGIYTTRSFGRFYLDTNAQSPYALIYN